MKELKFKTWDGNPIKAPCTVTYKVDGVRVVTDIQRNPLSRAGKPLYGLDNVFLMPEAHYEAYAGNFDLTSSIIRTQDGRCKLAQDELYQLWPSLDKRLLVGYFGGGLTSLEVKTLLSSAISLGYEGLVIRECGEDTLIKVKPKETFDVAVTGFTRGTGKNKGTFGAILTSHGKVGTGFTDKDRQEIASLFSSKTSFYPGMTGELVVVKFHDVPLVEVECMGLTKNGKFRHPRFLRLRWDK